MSDDESTTSEDSMISFKVKVMNGPRAITYDFTLPETTPVSQLREKLGGKEYEDLPVTRITLVHSGRPLKDDKQLSNYGIKPGNTINLVIRTASDPTPSTSSQVPAIPTNIAAGTPANNPLAGLTGARYAGQVNLPDRSMFGADGGMGAPPNGDQLADMLSDPNTAQMLNEALNNPDVIDSMIQNSPIFSALGPQAREILTPMLQSVQAAMSNPATRRDIASMSAGMRGGGGGGFAAPGETPTAEGAASTGAAGTGESPSAFTPGAPSAETMQNMMRMLGGGAGGGAGGFPDFASLMNPEGLAPGAGANPLADLLGSLGAGGAGGNPFAGGLPPPTPEQMQRAMAMFGQLGAGGAGSEGAQLPPFLGLGDAGLGGAGGGPAAPADTRPPEEQYAEQLRQLNDMGFFDFEENVRALRRAGGSVQGAINQLLG